ncbi:hypothetical protein [Collimonas antrihumi]|uniref:hypothetical protein n=1 Tax=Collimonas antrihumi TaxID=1940615 RepID=UPI001B8C4B53|nr:hypothetical protein [Collimonas antrihumi]
MMNRMQGVFSTYARLMQESLRNVCHTAIGFSRTLALTLWAAAVCLVILRELQFEFDARRIKERSFLHDLSFSKTHIKPGAG